jgi:pimeloyl-ACP methyl ester carboxylesterase
LSVKAHGLRGLIAIAMTLISLFVLEYARAGVQITASWVGQTPVTAYAMRPVDGQDVQGPVVVVAHGFAGSQQMMQGYTLPLAQAGYRVFAFEFLGHGRNPVPMSGDVAAEDGTTKLLVDQTMAVIDAVRAPGVPVALLGHSMASDILARVAAARGDVGPVVLISAFSNQIDAQTPSDLLLITGQGEPGLRAFAQDAVKMVDATVTDGGTATQGGVTRRAIVAPMTEHVSVLHSRTGRAAAVAWLDSAFGRQSDVAILPTGWAILGLLAGVVLLFRAVAGVLPVTVAPNRAPSARQGAALVLVPALLAPLIAVPLNPQILPVLVADYLGLHLFIYGALQLAALQVWGLVRWQVSWRAVALLAVWCALFGLALDRYVANFLPNLERVWIIAVLALGALPFMVADAVITAQVRFWARFAVRTGFLASLGIAVAMDFEGLFFLIMIAPVLLLFYIVFGTMGRCVTLRAGPVSSGLALGVVLAWALGVSFPLFQS